MARSRARVVKGSRSLTAANAKSRAVAKKGVTTSSDFKLAMSALMSDLVEGKVAPQVGNAVCNAGGKLLKVVEMEFKYGRNGDKGAPSRLALTA